MKYRITVTEYEPANPDGAEGETVFQMLLDNRPSEAKLLVALKPPRIRKRLVKDK